LQNAIHIKSQNNDLKMGELQAKILQLREEVLIYLEYSTKNPK